MKKEDPTIATLLKAQGYVTGQFGKNHLGDRDEMLPTFHGFDEFFGNLYHLNAEEEPEHPDYPKESEYPNFKKRFGPRGVIHCWADGKGGQKIENTGPLTKKRMETIDDETTAAALKFIDKAHKEGKPFFVWYNTTAMHFRTHCAEKHKGKSGQGDYNDVMVAHDEHIGEMLNKLDQLGIADDTIVMYSTDNGPHYNSWPDAGITPFRAEKNTNWEGGYRVPCAIRWPGVIKPGTVLNDIFAHEDMLPTLMAAAGLPDVKEQLLKGMRVGDKTFKVHLDGYNITDALAGKAPSPRHEFFYFNDDGSLVAIRYNQWKLVFQEQRSHGFGVWQDPFTTLRFPKLFNLRSDPFEMPDQHTMGYERWMAERMFLLVPAQQYVGQFLATFKEFPPSQKAGSFSLDRVMQALTSGASGS